MNTSDEVKTLVNESITSCMKLIIANIEKAELTDIRDKWLFLQRVTNALWVQTNPHAYDIFRNYYTTELTNEQFQSKTDS